MLSAVPRSDKKDLSSLKAWTLSAERFTLHDVPVAALLLAHCWTGLGFFGVCFQVGSGWTWIIQTRLGLHGCDAKGKLNSEWRFEVYKSLLLDQPL